MFCFNLVNFSKVNKTSITVCWSPPEECGGSKIKSYVIETSQSDEEKFTANARVRGDVSRFAVTGLKEETAYDVRVLASNEAGDGDACIPVTSVVTRDDTC